MEFMPTKGMEYAIILVYLALIGPFWWLLVRMSRSGPSPAAVRPARAAVRSAGPAPTSWFALPEGLHFHRGHTWVRPDEDGLLRVGMDDFAQRLLGRADALDLPEPGAQLSGGGDGWRARIGEDTVRMLSPVEGVVAEVNEDAAKSPERVNEDPYGSGWLLKIRPRDSARALANLMPQSVARTWMEEAARGVSALAGPQLGTVLQDGGRPVSGFVRQVGGERWTELAEELLLSRN